MYKLRVSRGRTINKGNYESARFDVSLEEEFEDTMDHDGAYLMVADIVRGLIIAEEENAKR